MNSKEYLLEKILVIVSERYKISIEDLKSKSRKEEIVQARNIYCYIAKKIGFSLQTIGMMVGNRHHTTIMHSASVVSDLVDAYPYMKKDIQDLELTLQKIFIQVSENEILRLKAKYKKEDFMDIYIAGKYSGLSEFEAMQNFLIVENKMTKKGFNAVHNPLKIYTPNPNLPKKEEWIQAMETLIPYVCKSDAIYLQKNWKDSIGSRIEYTIAKSLNKHIIFEEV